MAIIYRRDSNQWPQTNWDEFNEYALSRRGGEELQSCCCPSVDVYEDDSAFSLLVELPGLQKNDVKIEVENGTLTISGERKPLNGEQHGSYQRVERCYGDFSRSFTLGDIVDQQHIAATMDRGLLTVTLPKREETKARQIEVLAK